MTCGRRFRPIIPTEQELMNLYHVSRVTVRKATDRLVEADLLTRKPGYGTVVKERFFTTRQSNTADSMKK